MKSNLSAATLLAVLLAPSAVFAHAEEPNARSVHPLPNQGWVTRANFGIVTSPDPTRFVCEEAFYGGDDWLLGVLGPTEWLTFGEHDVRRTEDGCSFEVVTTLPALPGDATVHAPSGAVAYVLNEDDRSGLYLSGDRGRTFARVEAFPPASTHLTGVRFITADSLIVSAYDRDEARSGRLFQVGIDGTVIEHSLPADLTFPYVLDARGGAIALLARRDGQVVFWGPPDAIATADELEAMSWPTGARLSEDGNTLWVAGIDAGAGLTTGTRANGSVAWTREFEADAASCIGGDGAPLYLCGLGRLDGADVFAAEGGTRTALLDFRELRGPAQCPATSDVGAICPFVWQEIAPYFGVDLDADAGADSPDAADAGDPGPTEGDDGGPEDTITDSGCCATAAAGSTRTALLPLLFLVWGVARSRRRHQTPRVRR